MLKKVNGIYTNSTKTNKFYPSLMSATSYDHWQYVAKIDGKIVFNNFSYSMTTNKHQNEMRKLLNQLNIKVDLWIDAPRGLQNFEDALAYNEHCFESAKSKYTHARKEHTREYWKNQLEEKSIAMSFLRTVIANRKAA